MTSHEWLAEVQEYDNTWTHLAGPGSFEQARDAAHRARHDDQNAETRVRKVRERDEAWLRR